MIHLIRQAISETADTKKRTRSLERAVGEGKFSESRGSFWFANPGGLARSHGSGLLQDDKRH